MSGNRGEEAEGRTGAALEITTHRQQRLPTDVDIR